MAIFLLVFLLGTLIANIDFVLCLNKNLSYEQQQHPPWCWGSKSLSHQQLQIAQFQKPRQQTNGKATELFLFFIFYYSF